MRTVAGYCKKHMPADGRTHPFGLSSLRPTGAQSSRRRESNNPSHYPQYSDDFEVVCPVCEPPMQLKGGIVGRGGPSLYASKQEVLEYFDYSDLDLL